MILQIETIHQENDEVFVRAVVEDMVLAYPQTMEDPAEYRPAMCEATFYINEEDTLPEDEDDLVFYLENLDLEWKVVDDY